MDLAQASATPAESSSILRGPTLLRIIRKAGLEVPTLLRFSLWTPPLPGTSATLAVAAAGEDWASGVLASLAAGDRVLRDGTALFYGSFSLFPKDLSFSLPAETGDPPDFETLAAEHAAVLAGPPPGLPPDRGAECELRIDTGDRPMPRSSQMKRLSQGELEECRQQITQLLNNRWIVPSRTSHAASIVFARKADGTWRFCQDFRGLKDITQRSVEPIPHVDQLVDETRGSSFFSKLDFA